MCKCYGWLRHPRTTQELRLNLSPEHRPFIRGRRRRLRTAYDDIVVHYRKHTPWKRLRRTQYK